MDARPEDLKSFFEGFGNMSDCRILTGQYQDTFAHTRSLTLRGLV